jgi:Restriction Enzyme Adenine Methylase Associated
MWVEIDDDLAAAIEEYMRLGESLEQVVHRLIEQSLRRGAKDQRLTSHSRVVRRGSPKHLMDAGLVAAGDEVRYTEVRRGVTHMGRIDDDGRIHTDKGVEASPSTALSQLVNYSINGWAHWIHVRTGKTLATLREELRSQQQVPGAGSSSPSEERDG